MSKIKIQIKSRWTGNILFEYEKENNTIKDTVVEANLRGAYLSGADLSGAYLSGADLSGAYLSDANLRGADLSGAYLRGANLRGADLRGANLRGADLRGADLSDANLSGAYLRGADLSDANLSDAYLRGADLSDANLSDAKEIPYLPLACPSDGAFVAWKKVRSLSSAYLVKLQVPEDARRSSATTNKCRCDKAFVLDIYEIGNEDRHIDEIINTSQDAELLYKVGETVYPDSFDENRWEECSHGIHFFINKQDAINY